MTLHDHLAEWERVHALLDWSVDDDPIRCSLFAPTPAPAVQRLAHPHRPLWLRPLELAAALGVGVAMGVPTGAWLLLTIAPF